MSTFYILPPRPYLGDQVVVFLQKWFPGLKWRQLSSAELAEAVVTMASQHPDIYVVFREDLPDGVDLNQALAEDFGAAVGDEIVEFTGAVPNRWRLAA